MGRLPLAERTTATSISANGVDALLQQREESTADPLVVYFHGGGYARRRSRIDLLLAPREARRCSRPERGLSTCARASLPGRDRGRAGSVRMGTRRRAGGDGRDRGDSAGAGLLVAALVVMRDRGLPVPAGGVCLSPWVDLTNSAATYTTRAATDTMFSLEAAQKAAELYLHGHDPTDPLASPVYADLSGLPPLLILAGDAEVLLDDRAQARANGKGRSCQCRTLRLPRHGARLDVQRSRRCRRFDGLRPDRRLRRACDATLASTSRSVVAVAQRRLAP